MFDARKREIFEKLNLSYPAVAIKFCHNRPRDIPQVEGVDKFCMYLLKCQKEQRKFCIAAENEDCMGGSVMGFRGVEELHASGEVGYRTGGFCTPGPNARLYYEAPMFHRGTVNFVVFCPVAQCDFDPDLIVCIGDTNAAQIILRASSYRSGDIWESKASYVMSCSWTYVYPYLSGKINHLITGMHMGLKLFGEYPPGLHILSIPYQKINEVIDSLYEMKWEPSDEEGFLDRAFVEIDRMRESIENPVDL